MEEWPVIICGAGPVGLTTSILLSRQGIRSLVVERRDSVSNLPRARGIMSRTVEIWSQFGLQQEMIDFSLPSHWCQYFIYMASMSGEIIGKMPSNCMAPGAQADNTAYDFAVAAQDRIDSMLFRHAETYPETEIRFETEIIGYEQDDHGVTVQFRRANGTTEFARARWLIAADGGRSPLREMGQITSTGPEDLGSFVNNHFDADLSRWTAGREATLQWTFDTNKVGCFQPLDGKTRWMCQIKFDPEVDPFESWTRERVVRKLRDLIDDPAADDVEITLHSTYTYNVAASIADRFRDGRLLLVGDAAHRIPPAGGIGMNTGIQGAHNLVWKLAAVIRGEAPEALLDTYDVERREVAERACEYGVTNLGFIGGIQNAKGHEAKREVIARSTQYGNWVGLDLGVHYEGPGAFVPDDTPPPPVAHPVVDYTPCAKPGYRAPHIWLRDGEGRRSMTDLFERRFVLLTAENGASWRNAAAERGDVTIHEISVTGDYQPEGDFKTLYGIDADGAVLVRPDGHVAWRSPRMLPEPGAALNDAMNRTLQRAH